MWRNERKTNLKNLKKLTKGEKKEGSEKAPDEKVRGDKVIRFGNQSSILTIFFVSLQMIAFFKLSFFTIWRYVLSSENVIHSAGLSPTAETNSLLLLVNFFPCFILLMCGKYFPQLLSFLFIYFTKKRKSDFFQKQKSKCRK